MKFESKRGPDEKTHILQFKKHICFLQLYFGWSLGFAYFKHDL
jgi:hypothetical protein